MLLQKDMAQKKTKPELIAMSSNEMANHIVDITQTHICKDLKYCKLVNEIFLTHKQIHKDEVS